jgi:phage terminase small subunit
VEAVLDRYAITADRLAEEMARLAFTELRQVVDVRTETDPASGKRRQRVTLRDFSAIDADAHRALVEVKQSASGEVSVKLADKRGAIMDLARLKGLIVDKPPEQKQLVMLKIER